MNVIMIAGKFDLLHDGHIDHIKKAAKLGDYLIVVTHVDVVVAANSKKNKCIIPLWARVDIVSALLAYYGIKGRVVVAQNYGDVDGTVAKTLEAIRPRIFAKGGDRVNNSAMPACEVEVCERLGIKIEYGVGDLLNSSTKIAEALLW